MTKYIVKKLTLITTRAVVTIPSGGCTFSGYVLYCKY